MSFHVLACQYYPYKSVRFYISPLFDLNKTMAKIGKKTQKNCSSAPVNICNIKGLISLETLAGKNDNIMLARSPVAQMVKTAI